MSRKNTPFDLLQAVALQEGLSGVDLRVFLYLTARLDSEQFQEVPQAEIAHALGRRKEHITRSMAKLKAAGVIEGVKAGRAAEWRFNPKYGK